VACIERHHPPLRGGVAHTRVRAVEVGAVSPDRPPSFLFGDGWRSRPAPVAGLSWMPISF
jgi:hypothetical protein